MSKHPDTCIVVGCEGTVAGFAELTADFPLPGKGGLAVVVSVCDEHFEVLQQQWAMGTRLDEGSAVRIDRLTLFGGEGQDNPPIRRVDPAVAGVPARSGRPA